MNISHMGSHTTYITYSPHVNSSNQGILLHMYPLHSEHPLPSDSSTHPMSQSRTKCIPLYSHNRHKVPHIPHIYHHHYSTLDNTVLGTLPPMYTRQNHPHNFYSDSPPPYTLHKDTHTTNMLYSAYHSHNPTNIHYPQLTNSFRYNSSNTYYRRCMSDSCCGTLYKFWVSSQHNGYWGIMTGIGLIVNSSYLNIMYNFNSQHSLHIQPYILCIALWLHRKSSLSFIRIPIMIHIIEESDVRWAPPCKRCMLKVDLCMFGMINCKQRRTLWRTIDMSGMDMWKCKSPTTKTLSHIYYTELYFIHIHSMETSTERIPR